MCVLRFGVSFTYVIESTDSKLISVCLIDDYLLIADLHIFAYGSAECATISLKYTKVKILISKNFDCYLNIEKITLLIGYQKIFFIFGTQIIFLLTVQGCWEESEAV